MFIMAERQVAKMPKDKLGIKFISYDLLKLQEEDINDLTQFVVKLAEQGFKDNIIKGAFPGKDRNE